MTSINKKHNSLSCCLLCWYLLSYCFCLLSNGQTSVFFFFALWHCWHCFGSPDPLCEMFTVIVVGYLQQAHCPIHFLVQKNNKQTAKWMAAKSGKLLTVTVKSNHPSSSSNSPHLSRFLSLGMFTSHTPLSQSPSPHGRGLSAQSVCSGCVWPCVNVHCLIVSQWAHVGHTVCMLSVCYGPHVAADKLGRFGQGSGTWTSICK